MPTKLLNSEYGIPKSRLEQVNATVSDVTSGKTYIGSDGLVHTGTLTDYGRDPRGTACSIYGNDILFLLPGGDTKGIYQNTVAYEKNKVMAQDYDGWHVIAYGCKADKNLGNTVLTNLADDLTWAHGWSKNLPYGNYRICFKFGQCSTGGIHCWITVGGVAHQHNYGVYWNGDDVILYGVSGELTMRWSDGSGLNYERNPCGYCAFVLHSIY